jgi:hypothetical protein
MVLHRHLVVDVTVTGARTNSNVVAMGDLLPLNGSRAAVAHDAKLDDGLRTPSCLGMPSV